MDISEWDREYVIEGELVDTYGGDYTYQNVFYALNESEVTYGIQILNRILGDTNTQRPPPKD